MINIKFVDDFMVFENFMNEIVLYRRKKEERTSQFSHHCSGIANCMLRKAHLARKEIWENYI